MTSNPSQKTSGTSPLMKVFGQVHHDCNLRTGKYRGSFFCFFVVVVFCIKISKLALPGVMLKYERGQYLKKERSNKFKH